MITLLAHCRELQPTRTISISSLKKQYSVKYSPKDDDSKVITHSSSYSDALPSITTDRPDDFSTRKRIFSESVLTKLSTEPIRLRSQSLSEKTLTAKCVKNNGNIGACDSGDKNSCSKENGCSGGLPKVDFIKKQPPVNTSEQQQPEKVQFVFPENSDEKEVGSRFNKSKLSRCEENVIYLFENNSK